MSKFNVGDKVKYIGKDHKKMPEFYPEIGIIGTVVKEDVDGDWSIQWPKGSTSGKDCWYCNENDIELVINMTNKEIWKMLRPKMEKNWLVPHWENKELAYYQSDVANAIAIAYRSGYERAMKGRPFKIGEKKKKGGHWEPVDPNSLPKEGTRVRLNKPYDNYYGGIIEAGTVGCVFHDTSYGSRVNGYGVNFGEYKTIWFPLNRTIIADCLDMWVEDNE